MLDCFCVCIAVESGFTLLILEMFLALVGASPICLMRPSMIFTCSREGGQLRECSAAGYSKWNSNLATTTYL